MGAAKKHIEAAKLSGQLDLRHDERIECVLFRRAADWMDWGNPAGPRTLLKLHPSLIHQHVFGDGGNDFRSPAVLEFIAKNPLRQGRMPDKNLAVAEVPLDAGPSRALRNETRR